MPLGDFLVCKDVIMARALSKKLRFQILSRDSFSCVYCGKNGFETELEVDHVVPKSKGGSDDPTNLVTSCFECNRGKSSASMSDVVSTEILISNTNALAKMAEAEAAKIKAARSAKRQFNKLKKEIESLLELEINKIGERAIKQFISRLCPASVLEAAEITSCKNISSGRWRYFCGVCWNKIRQLELDERGT